ncbi:isochorismate synthase [Halanaeroarchaeum sulfurireducens]|uniref:isochorismate synthase n=1 Tax=Halanaeroarchaeum sulfurireducens TaxID=1604004 RepID=A0A0N9N9Z2_9EURY|nr:isochorismate synthase [Halanaeroarchaeum sulfurireducens]ALG82187.1 isochorismate synthase [Halanaeroarchaeum sulfurireducens]
MASRDGQDRVQTAGRLVSRSVSIPPTALRDVLRLDRPIHAAVTAPDGPTVVASGSAATATAEGADRFAGIRETATTVYETVDDDSVPDGARPRFVGGFAFHDRHERAHPWDDFPGAWFALPSVQIVLGEDGGWITATGNRDERSPSEIVATAESVRDGLVSGGPAEETPGVSSVVRETTLEEWTEQLEGALSRIDAGDIEKVALAQTLRANLEAQFPLASVIERLGETYPDCFLFALRPGAGYTEPTHSGEQAPPVPTFFGASPERLVTKAGDTVRTGALASTVGRGDTETEDDRLADRLRTDEKFQREHRVVVESIREQLTPVARNVQTGSRTVRRLDSVQHLYTPIEATATADHVLAVVTALHPTPAVGGLPPDVALETIRNTETFDRGWYAAPVGWFDEEGDGTFAVGIRSAVGEDREATLFAGNGIVADSDPVAEWEEVQLKYEPILDALR